MVNILRPERRGDVSDVAWHNEQNFHVYEQAERARGDSTGIAGNWDNAGAKAAFDIRIAKARALDKARQRLIEAVQEQEVQLLNNGIAPDQVTRSVNGVEGAPDSAIML